MREGVPSNVTFFFGDLWGDSTFSEWLGSALLRVSVVGSVVEFTMLGFGGVVGVPVFLLLLAMGNVS